MERRKAELTAKNPDLKVVSGDWHYRGEDAELPGRETYTELTPKELQAILGAISPGRGFYVEFIGKNDDGKLTDTGQKIDTGGGAAAIRASTDR